MTLMLRFAARSDVGLIRTNNEDAVYAGPRLVAVADGMGGHAAGDVASAVTIATLAPLDDDDPPSDLLGILEQTIRAANEQLRSMMDADDQLDGMGTTLTALLWGGNRLALAHIGDSRAYLLRDGELVQITHDHTLVQHLVDEGQLDESEIPTHPQRSVILRVLNGRPDAEADLSIREARAGDRYLLCSDGLSGVVSKQTLSETLALARSRAGRRRTRRSGPAWRRTRQRHLCGVRHRRSRQHRVGSAGHRRLGRRRQRSARARTQYVGRPGRGVARASASGPSSRHRRYEPARRRWRGPALVLGLLMLAAGGLFGGTWWYSQHQFYVGTDGTNVIVYKGIDGTVLGIHYSSAIENTGIAVSSLPQFERERVTDTIGAQQPPRCRPHRRVSCMRRRRRRQHHALAVRPSPSSPVVARRRRPMRRRRLPAAAS